MPVYHPHGHMPWDVSLRKRTVVGMRTRKIGPHGVLWGVRKLLYQASVGT